MMRLALRSCSYSLCLLLSFPSMTLLAQTLKLSSAQVSRGDRFTIVISLRSPPGNAPAALQWDTVIPAAKLSFRDHDMEIGPAAQQAGKSIACAVKAQTEKTVTAVCILAGGHEPISNGVIALLKLRALEKARPGSALIRVERAIAVSADATEVPIEPLETAVSIRAK